MSLTPRDMLRIAHEANLFKQMGENHARIFKLDYVPARPAMILPREKGEEGPLNLMPPEAVELTYILEDAMFGGTVYVALTCGGHIIIHPFEWHSYDKLSKTAIPEPR